MAPLGEVPEVISQAMAVAARHRGHPQEHHLRI